ncbi:MAG: cytochrome C [Planctomycetota bacterium]|nr:cytochrome C [Planctomycetota bacterium]
MRKALILLALTFGLGGAGVYAYLLFTGPRMIDQPSLQAFNAVAPPPPQGAVPVGASATRPAPAAAAPTAENLARGRIYYAYYCLPCHGALGAGDGPVGQSYTPAPADLRSPRLRSLSDSDYLRASLTGVGHSPVLDRIVPQDHRPCLLLYSRSLVVPSATTNPAP